MQTECRVPLVEVSITDDLDLACLARTRQVFDRLLTLRPAHVVVDLSACRHLDAAAVGLLLDVHRQLAGHRGVLSLRDPGVRVRRVLRATGLDRVLPVVPAPAARELVRGSTSPAAAPRSVGGGAG